MEYQEKIDIIYSVLKHLHSKDISVDDFYRQIKTDERLERQKNCKHINIEFNYHYIKDPINPFGNTILTGTNDSCCLDCGKGWAKVYVANNQHGFDLEEIENPNYF